MDKKKILSSLALAGILTASVLGANVNAATEEEYLKPVGVFKKLNFTQGETVVSYMLKNRREPLTVKDINSGFKNLESINGIKVTDMGATVTTGDTFIASGKKYTVVVYGDVNQDGIITTSDATMIQRIRTNKEPDVTPAQKEAADLYNDDKISTVDASRVQRYITNKPDCAVIIDPLPEIEDVTAPIISGVPSEPIYVNINDQNFKLPEVTAVDDYDGEVDVTVSGEVDITKAGEYKIVYTAKDREENPASAILTVIVDDEAPVITGIPEGNKIYVKKDGEIKLPEVKAIDAVDGEIDVELVITNSDGDKVEIDDIDTSVNGEYTLTYTTSQDTLGKTSTETVTLVVDVTPPVIVATYSPNVDVVTNGNVIVTINSDKELKDTLKADGWTLSEDKKSISKEYEENIEETEITVEDLAGNTSKTKIKVINIDKIPPEVSGVEEGKAYKQVQPTYNTNEVSVATYQKEGEEPKEYVPGTKIGKADKTEDGKYTLIVKDVAGNETTITFVIDNEAPVLKTESEASILLKKGDEINIIVTAEDEVDGPVETELTITNSDGEEVENINDIDTTVDGEYTFTYTATDEAGNVATNKVIAVKVDATKATYKKTVSTNKNPTTEVSVILTFNEPMQAQPEESGWVQSNDKKTFTKKYTEIEEENTSFKDLAGNETTVNYIVDNIDSEELQGKAFYDNNKKPVKKVEVNIRANKELKPLSQELIDAGWSLNEDKKSIKREYNNNVTETVKIEDLAGHITEVEVKITNIDLIKPEAQEIKYSNESTDNLGTIEPTNEDVVVTVKANENLQLSEELQNAGWELSKENEITKTYSENKTEKIKLVDIAGNESDEITINVTKIDKKAPVINGLVDGKVYYKDQLALTFADEDNNGVTVSLKKENQDIEVDEAVGITLGGANKHEDEGRYVLVVTDDLGNTDTKEFVIDITPVEVTGVEDGGKYNSAKPIFTEGVGSLKYLDITDKVEQIKSGDEITDNGNYELTVKDAAGNETIITFVIDNTLPKFTNITEDQLINGTQLPFTPAIDKVAKKASLKRNGETVEGYTSLQAINDEGKYELTVTDEAGNEATINFVIDKEVKDVRCNISNVTENGTAQATNEDVIITITSSEELQLTQELSDDDWTLSIDKKTLTKKYEQNTSGDVTVVVKDKAGNQKNVTFAVTGIDKVAPQLLSLTYSNTDSTDPSKTIPAISVTVTIEADKELKELETLKQDGWKLTENKKTIFKVYEEDKEETIKIEDLAGNSKEIEINVTNIYKGNPSITLTGGLAELTTEVSKEQGKIQLPTVTAKDIKGNSIDNVIVNIKKIQNGEVIDLENANTITELDVSSVCNFVITYTAVDVAGNRTVETRNIIVK